jgi:hypothetical protein
VRRDCVVFFGPAAQVTVGGPVARPAPATEPRMGAFPHTALQNMGLHHGRQLAMLARYASLVRESYTLRFRLRWTPIPKLTYSLPFTLAASL